MDLTRVERVAGGVIFLAGCSVWIWAPHTTLLARSVVAGVLGAIGWWLMLRGQGADGE